MSLSLPFEGAVQDLIDALGAMPGIGPKSAPRIAFHLIAAEHHEDGQRLAAAITRALTEVHFCKECHNVSEGDLCRICRDPRRDAAVLCVVGEHVDVSAIEKTRGYSGRYHVLGGTISPIEGIGPDELNIKSLVKRLADGVVTEVIIALDPNLEGEATATYLSRLIRPMGVKVTRIATGVPVGSAVNYADELTLGRAVEGRRSMTG